MANKKTIRCFCYGPITLHPKNESPWEDVWIQYKVRRKTVKEGPCFLSREALKGDIRFEKMLVEKHPNLAKHYNVNELILIDSLFDTGIEYFVDDSADGIPNIYINKPSITKDIVEEALTWYLRQKGVLKSVPRFQWKKPDIIVMPVSFPAEESNDPETISSKE